MTPSIEPCVVPLHSRHIGAVAHIESLVFSDPWGEATLHEELTNPLSRWFVLEQDGQVLGYVATMDVCGEVHITNVAVLPACRRRGYARLLLTQAVKTARGGGALCLTLEVRESNAPAIALYRTFGFAPVGLRPHYYHNPEESALLMTLFFSEDTL